MVSVSRGHRLSPTRPAISPAFLCYPVVLIKLGSQVKAGVNLVGQKTLLNCGLCRTGLKTTADRI